jgi:FkbM family methyltransferase
LPEAKSAPAMSPLGEGTACRKRRKAVLGAAILLGLAVALLAVGRTDRGQVWLVRSFLRVERVWNIVVPPKSGKGLIGKLEPFMSRIGLLRPVWLQVEPGINMLLDPSDLVSKSILTSLHSRWDRAVWEAISPRLSDGQVMLDVGAHIGYFTLKGSVRVGKSGRVVAFEPNPRTVAKLRTNVAASHAANVIIIPVACTDSETTLKFYDATARGNSGASSLSPANAGKRSREFTVRGRPIDDVLRELGIQRVDVMKVDVEGAELYVLRGAKETLQRFHPKLVIEVVPRQLAGMNTTVEQLFSFIKQMGYTRGRQFDDMDWEWTVE